jgi:ABC-2 type transport system permease protein
MTVTAAPSPKVFVSHPARPARFSDVLRSEWTKVRTVRSTFFTLLAAVVLEVGVGALICLAVSSNYSSTSPSDRLTFDPTATSLVGLALAQLAIGVLSVLMITSEYSTGMIRTTMAAVPKRGRLLAAKAVVFAALAFVVVEIASFIAYFLGQAILGLHAPTTTIGDPHVLRAIIGAGLYAALFGLIGLGLGALLRHTAGIITILVAVAFILPGVSAALPDSWSQPIQEYWPTLAGSQIYNLHRGDHSLSAWTGFGVMCAYVVVLLAVAFWVIQHRDA